MISDDDAEMIDDADEDDNNGDDNVEPNSPETNMPSLVRWRGSQGRMRADLVPHLPWAGLLLQRQNEIT